MAILIFYMTNRLALYDATFIMYRPMYVQRRPLPPWRPGQIFSGRPPINEKMILGVPMLDSRSPKLLGTLGRCPTLPPPKGQHCVCTYYANHLNFKTIVLYAY